MDVNGIIERFTNHKMNSEQVDDSNEIKKLALELAMLIDLRCPDSREKSSAITKLEEAVFFVTAGIARRR